MPCGVISNISDFESEELRAKRSGAVLRYKMTKTEATYRRLKRILNDDTKYHSNPKNWLEHQAYKYIVALGEAVVPFIIEDLKRSLETGNHYPGWWVMYALPEITGARIKTGGKEVQVEGGFVKVSVEDVSRFWVNWYENQQLIDSKNNDESEV